MDNIVENPVNNTVEDFLSFLQKEPSIDKKEIEKKKLIVEKTETMVKECEKCTKLKNEIGKLENTCVVTGEKCAMDFVSGVRGGLLINVGVVVRPRMVVATVEEEKERQKRGVNRYVKR